MAEAAVSKATKRAQRDERGRFLPGTAAGPGRPKSTTPITDILRAAVERRPYLVEKWCDMAEEDWRAFAAILERLEPTAKVSGDVNIGQAVINIVRTTPELGVGS